MYSSDPIWVYSDKSGTENTELFVAGGHRNEMGQAFPVLRHAMPLSAFDECDPDPPITGRQSPEVLPGGRVCPHGPGYSRWNPSRSHRNRFGSVCMSDRRKTRARHLPGGYEPLNPFPVRLGKHAPRPPRGKSLGITVSVNPFYRTINPPVTKRLLNSLFVSNTRFPGVLLGVDQPYLAQGVMVLSQPFAPIFRVMNI